MTLTLMFVAAVVVLSKYERVCYCFDIRRSSGSSIKYMKYISSKCMVGDGEVVAPDGR